MKADSSSFFRCTILILATFALLGCQQFPARINHFHSDSRQLLAQQNVDTFEGIASQGAGTVPTLLSNLTAQEQLSRTVAAYGIRVNDTDRATALTDESWDDLRENLYLDCGLGELVNNPTPEDLDGAHHELEKRLAVRLSQINIIAKLLEILADWNQALVTQSSKTVKQAGANLTALTTKSALTPPDTNAIAPSAPNSGKSFADLFKQLQTAVIQAGRSQLTNENVLTNTTALVRSILEGAEASRDPASVYALAPLIGSGLDDRSSVMLTNYIAYLHANLSSIDPSQLSDAGAQGRIKKKLGDIKKMLSWNDEQGKDSKFKVLNAPGNQETITTAAEFVSTALKSVTNVSARLPEIAKLTALANSNLAKEIDDFSNTLKKIQNSANLLHGGTNAAEELVAALSAGDPKIAKILNDTNLLNPADVQQLGKVISDINNERDAATRLVLDYFQEVSRVELNLHQENLRHFQVIALVATKELDRWHLISRYLSSLKTVFEGRTRPAGPNAAPHLFAANVINDWNAYYTANPSRPGFTFSPSGPFIPPDISTKSKILPSIRLLAENAQLWQHASPSDRDPLGLATARSIQRLSQGIRIIQCYMLISSVSESMSTDNGIRLRTEVLEHGIHLDAIVARVEEATVRFGLKDLLAFHSSGLTENDIQAAVGIVQSALVAWIGAKL